MNYDLWSSRIASWLAAASSVTICWIITISSVRILWICVEDRRAEIAFEILQSLGLQLLLTFDEFRFPV